MKPSKEQIAVSIMRARTDLEQALLDLEKLPLVDPGVIAYMAHALNNYLSVSEATIDMLAASLADHPDPDIVLWLGTLRHATGLMSRAVSQMMTTTFTPDTKLQFQKVDVALGLQRLCSYYQPKADQKHLRLEYGPFVGLPPVWTDRVAAGAVMDNLLSNAVKYSPSGNSITVKAYRQRDSVVCSVCDQGPGLSQEEQAHLFEPGVRLGPEPTGGEPSAGYGLAVARDLVVRLGGSIWCESSPGQGSCFFVRLPAYQEQIHGPEPNSSDPHEVY